MAASMLKNIAHPDKIFGGILEAKLQGVSVDEICLIRSGLLNSDYVAKAQVIALDHDKAVLSLIGTARGLTKQAIIEPTGRALSIKVGNFLLGCVVDASATVTERLGVELLGSQEIRPLETAPPSYLMRLGIKEKLETGIRVIDGLLTCGIGQRIGIFASAGCGKTVLIHTLIEHTEADVFVVGLIGERGREVTEFAEKIRKSPKKEQCVIVFATSDFSSVDRCNAALTATTIAEYFRDQGKNVVLYIDSMTRYARALRDVMLASGHPPSRRGYPVAVFDSLPHFLERPGTTHKGSITAFYTVLLEGEDESDPLAEEIRSILDGHIVLSRKLAGQGHYPAIDVLKSTSRVFGQVTTKEHQKKANNIRALLTKLEELKIVIDLGEYVPGNNKENDKAVKLKEPLDTWLCQQVDVKSKMDETLKGMSTFE
ncbi:type III secretion system ATPase SctN [Escherichia marmotae]|nr:type III secretion system ATPase SctN [Escherichia marmotae]MED9360027.1 type III secretion system ATPase SctN [Escherichia marmotae]